MSKRKQILSLTLDSHTPAYMNTFGNNNVPELLEPVMKRVMILEIPATTNVLRVATLGPTNKLDILATNISRFQATTRIA